nr:class I SAM-dependent methyltransferase [Acinetobacter sp. Marseille-Q1620]
MKWLQVIQQQFPKHKYAINAKQLGDKSLFAWSNLGYWAHSQNAQLSYPQACKQLAQHLADSIHLNSTDRLLDLGCGQGASLNLWLEHYNIQHLQAVELQAECVDTIRNHLPQLEQIYCHSFVDLQHVPFPEKFTAVICIDAAYHSNLHQFLNSVVAVLQPNGRIAFHYLMFSEKWYHLSTLQKEKYRFLLKTADVDSFHIHSHDRTLQILAQHQFQQVQVEDISESVFNGFAQYIKHARFEYGEYPLLDTFKIKMTAKLCRKLYEDRVVRYVQICGRYKKKN